MAKKRKPLTPEQAMERLVRGVRSELHRGLDQVLDTNMPAFLKLLDGGYVLVATVHPFLETASGEASKDGVLDPAVAGSIRPSGLLAPDGTPLMKH